MDITGILHKYQSKISFKNWNLQLAKVS